MHFNNRDSAPLDYERKAPTSFSPGIRFNSTNWLWLSSTSSILVRRLSAGSSSFKPFRCRYSFHELFNACTHTHRFCFTGPYFHSQSMLGYYRLGRALEVENCHGRIQMQFLATTSCIEATVTYIDE